MEASRNKAMARKSLKGKREVPQEARHAVNDMQWEHFSGFLTDQKTGGRGRPRASARRMLGAIRWVLRTGAPWRDLPQGFGPWQTAYGWFRKWVADGVFERILVWMASRETDEEQIDSSIARAQKSALGAAAASDGPGGQCLGAGRGGVGTKIHVKVNCHGQLLDLLLTPAEASDSKSAVPLLSSGSLEGVTVLADKAYGSAEIRGYIATHGGSYQIPPKSNTKEPWPLDKEAYKRRHHVENFFQRIKLCRGVATRYDKLASVFEAKVILAALWS
jgi:transposase